MKKNFDLESAEKWAEKCFSGIEKNIICERMPDIKECTLKNNKTRYTDERSPLLEVAGVFAAAVLVVCLTFGALRYLEHVANQHGPAGADTSASDTGKEPTDTSSLNGTDTEPPDDTADTGAVTDTPNETVITINDVSVVKTPGDVYVLYVGDGPFAEPFPGGPYSDAEKWNGMILLTKDGKQFLYKTEFYGTAYNRHRYGFLFPDLKDGFDGITQISEGVYVIENDGRKFPATLYGERMYEDIDCTDVKYADADRVLITSGKEKTGLYYVGYGVFEELYPQKADEILYCAEPTYTEDGDRFDLFFAKENGCYAVLSVETDVYGSVYSTRASDFIYTEIKTDDNGVVTAEYNGKTYYISPYDGSQSEEMPKDHRVIQTIGGYKVIRYYRNLGCGVVDSDGNTVIPFEYWMIYAVSEDRFFCSKIKGEDGVILDNNGNLIADGFRFMYPITPVLEHGNRFENLYLAERNGDAVWIDKDGNVVGLE